VRTIRRLVALDPHLPVLVGIGELVRRPGDERSTDPAELMAEAVRDAAADAGAGDALLRRAGAIGAVPSVAWGDGDPGRRVGELLGIHAPTLRTSRQGGNGPQLMVNALAARIQAGELDAAIVCGAEALSTVARLLKQGEAPPWPEADPDRAPGEVLEEDRAAATEAELAAGLIAPIFAYPLIENAIRAAAGRPAGDHLDRVARLWSRFSAVAAEHDAAWTPRTFAPAELATPSDGNRQVTFPYTKLLNANIQVDQAAALVLCSARAAAAAGVPRDRWVFLHAGARATDEWFLSERRALHRSPAIRACGSALFAHAGVTPEDLGPVDLYSCFPSAVQLAAAELGLPLDDPARELTCTGGLTFFGGPGNNYATHGIAAVARRLREAPPGELGLSTALGWYATKHALGLYGNAPPERAYAALVPVPEPGFRAVAESHDGTATAETCTVIYDRGGAPSHGLLFALLDDGRRGLARTGEPDVLAAMTQDGFLGSRVTLHADGSFSL
jgi:acetyl-CoA C-acetyltransferase